MPTMTLSRERARRPTNWLGPAAIDIPRPSPHWTHTLSIRLYMVAVFLLPVQLEIEGVKAILGSRLPPGDVFLALSVILAPASFRVMRRPLGHLPLALPLVLGYGLVISLTLQGHASSHAVNVKFLGSAVLVVTGVVTIAYAQAGYTARILKTFLAGVATWGAVGYVDWAVADILPWLDPDVESRFGALQFDPNNAGAMFAVAFFLSAFYGHRLFARRWVWIVLTLLYAAALYETLSRGAYIAAGAALLIVLIVDRVGAERWLKLLAGGVIAGAILLASGTIDSAVDDFSRRPDTVSSRGEFVDIAVDRWVDSRGLGMGLGTFKAENDRIVHNTGVWLVVEMSLPGLVFFVAMIVVPFAACLRMRDYDHDLAIALIGAHTVMIVASVAIEALYQRSWWLIIGLTVLPTAAIQREQNAAARALTGERTRTRGVLDRQGRRRTAASAPLRATDVTRSPWGVDH